MKSFDDLDVKELYRAAVEDFALPVEKDDNKKSLIAAFTEAGFGWKDYVAQHPELGPVEEIEIVREAEVDRGNVVTSASQKPVAVVEAPVIRTEEPFRVVANDKYLVKMDRENILFEIRGYRFTQEHPFQLVDADDVEHVLEEDGFRMAKPSEAREYYG